MVRWSFLAAIGKEEQQSRKTTGKLFNGSFPSAEEAEEECGGVALSLQRRLLLVGPTRVYSSS